MVDEVAPTTVALGNLPGSLDRFVGRSNELRVLREALDGPGRVVSVLGPGGTGKTRLVQELGGGLSGEFPGGVWWVDLTEARSLEGICADAPSLYRDVPSCDAYPYPVAPRLRDAR